MDYEILVLVLKVKWFIEETRMVGEEGIAIGEGEDFDCVWTCSLTTLGKKYRYQ